MLCGSSFHICALFIKFLPRSCCKLRFYFTIHNLACSSSFEPLKYFSFILYLPRIWPRHPQPLYKIQGLGDWLHDAGLKNDKLNLLYLANKYANVALKTSTKNLRQDSHKESNCARYSLGKSFVYNLGG